MSKTVLHIIFLLLTGFSYAQSDNELYDHRLDDSKWESIKDHIRYEGGKDGPGREWTYEDQQEFQKAQKEYGKNNSGSGNGNGDGGYGSDGGNSRPVEYNEVPDYEAPDMDMPNMNWNMDMSWLGYVLITLLILAVIALIVYFFLNRQTDGKKLSQEVNLEEINPIEIPLTELERLLKEALDKGDYRGAVRIYFIFIIRDLSQRKSIHWEKEKTNFQYLREMVNSPYYDDFNRSVSYFEIIWYGKREIDHPVFEQVKPNFTNLLNRLGVR